MADKLIIEIFREKNAEEFTKALAAPDSRLETGSAAAMTAMPTVPNSHFLRLSSAVI